MRNGGLLVVGLFAVLASVTACQSGVQSGGTPALTTVPSSIVGRAPIPPVSTSLPPVGTTSPRPVIGHPPIIARPPTVIPVPSQPTTPVPASEINSTGMLNPPRSVQVTKDGRYVVFTAEEAGCQQITAQVTSQTSTEVIILVITTSTRKPNQMCPMIVREVAVAAQLSAPLNGRTIAFQGVKQGG